MPVWSAEIIQNKQRQFWWDFRKYAARASWFFTIFEKALSWVMGVAMDIGRGMSALILFFVPVLTALAVMAVVALAAAIGYAAVMLIVLIAFAVWMPVIDLIHLFLIAGYRVWESIRRGILKRNIFVCPYCHVDMWKTKWKLPLHACPKCAEKHPWVWPNTYGILNHKCGGRGGKCDAKIPAIYRRGKAELARYCPSCGKLITIKQFGFLPRLGIGMIGAPGAGKTSVMVAALDELQTQTGKLGLGIHLADKVKVKDFEKLRGAFNEETLAPTGNGNHEALVWRVTTRGDDFLMYMYDPGGEVYASQESQGNLEFLRRVNGLILMIDPSSLGTYSDIDPEIVLRSVLRFVERETGRVGQQFDIPLAVVLSKSDEDPDAPDPHGVRARLGKLQPNLMNLIEHRFKPVQYFSASATAKIGVVGPLLWLLTCCRKWGK